jgi:hypothetical protein
MSRIRRFQLVADGLGGLPPSDAPRGTPHRRHRPTTSFQALSDNGAAGVRGIQAGLPCGACDALSAAFWDAWHSYLMAKWSAEFGVDLFFQFVPGAEVVKVLAGQAVSYIIDKAVSGAFACNFGCYFEEIPKVWYLYMAEYYVGKGAASLVQDFKIGYLGCPAGASGGLRFSAFNLLGPQPASLCARSL